MKKVLLSLTLVIVATTAFSESYRAEADFSYIAKDDNVGGFDGVNFRGTYFFSDVTDTNVPLAEAAFLSRASSIFAVLGYGNPEQGNIDVGTYGFGGAYINDAGLLFGAHYVLQDYSGGGAESELDDVLLQFGTYIDNDGLLTFNFNVGQATQVDGDEKDANIVSVNYKHLFQYDNGMALGVKAKFAYTNFEEEDAADLRNLTLGGDYYINSNLSIGLMAGFTRSDASNSAVHIGGDIRYYFNSHIGVYVSAERFDYSDTQYEIDTYQLGIIGRF